MSSQRGAVLVESAIVLSLLLTVIYGGVQLGVVGLEQISADGGAYTAAHQQALLGANPQKYMDAVTLAKQTLPILNQTNVSIPEPVYGEPPPFNDASVTNALNGYETSFSNARHGGVSMIQPVQTISSVSHTSLPSILLGALTQISVSGISIDPAYRLVNGHGDVSGSSFGTAAAFATASDPLVDGSNTPPYFVGFNYMKSCPFTTTAWTSCAQPFFAGLGMAEYLDTNNWSRPLNGVVPNPGAVFWEARLHQNEFANISLKLSASPNDATDAAILDPRPGVGDPDTACVYSMDNDSLGSYQIGSKKIGDYPLHPAGNPACPLP